MTLPNFDWLFSPPFSALTIFGVSLLWSLTTTLLSRKLTDPRQTAIWQEEFKRWNADKERAKKAGDKKLLSKLKKQEKRIGQMQSKMLKRQTLNLFIMIGLFYLFWQLLIFLFRNANVAYVPFGIPFLATPLPYPLPFFYWYIICSFFSSSILSRVLGVSMGMGMPPQTTS